MYAYRRNLLGDIDVLGQLHLALLDRTCHVGFLDRFAEVGFLVDERDEAVFDLEVHLRAFVDRFLELARGRDAEGLSTRKHIGQRMFEVSSR